MFMENSDGPDLFFLKRKHSGTFCVGLPYKAVFTNWVSQASPTLGCSIKISRVICRYARGMSIKKYVCQNV